MLNIGDQGAVTQAQMFQLARKFKKKSELHKHMTNVLVSRP
jgi:predicted transcriptional regulator